jgi:hypothetical protein
MIDKSIVDALEVEEPGPAVIRALSELLRRDAYLLLVDANERSAVFRLAMYLQAELPDWDVDCEYNRDDIDPKKIRHLGLDPHDEDTDARTAFPDVIVHHRGTKENYLVMEIKKSTSTISRDTDYAKLRGYQQSLGFRYALFLELSTAGQAAVGRAEWVRWSKGWS